MDGKWQHSAQALSHNAFIRIPCEAHTGELALGDLVDKNRDFHYIVKQINKIIKTAKQIGITVHKITERWRSKWMNFTQASTI